MNSEEIVWKEDNIWIKMWYQTPKRKENPTIRKIKYHVTEVDDKKVQHNLTYQLSSSRLTIKMMH